MYLPFSVQSLVAAKPDAVWIYQGYPWFRVYSQGASCNQTALRRFIKVRVSGDFCDSQLKV